MAWAARQSRAAHDLSPTSKVRAAASAAASAANIAAAAEAFAAAADFSDGNLGPDSTSVVAGPPDFTDAGQRPDFSVSGLAPTSGGRCRAATNRCSGFSTRTDEQVLFFVSKI